MSEFSETFLSDRMEDLRASAPFDAYSGVEIVVGDDTQPYFKGSRTGRVLIVENEWGSAIQATKILARIRGYQYQPFSAGRALLDPAAELGDGVNMEGLYSTVEKIARNYTALMASDVEAPQDEELDHEFPFEPKQDRVFKREINNARAQISITQDQITFEATRATAAEGSLSSRITQTANRITSEITRAENAENTLSSRITQTADSIASEITGLKNADSTLRSSITQTSKDITAEVTRATKAEGTLQSKITANATSISAKVSKTGGNSAAFGWTLTDSSWVLQANGSTVFKATKSGIEVKGKITATSGFIGNGSSGFTISATAIYNKINNLGDDSKSSGIYLGTDGIRLGKNFVVDSYGKLVTRNMEAYNLTINGGSIKVGDNFAVSAQGTVTAKDMILSGTLRIGSSSITADALRSGAQSAYNNGGYWSGGARGGYAASDAFDRNVKVTYINCKNFHADLGGFSQLTIPYGSQVFLVAGQWVTWKSVTINGVTINYLGR